MRSFSRLKPKSKRQEELDSFLEAFEDYGLLRLELIQLVMTVKFLYSARLEERRPGSSPIQRPLQGQDGQRSPVMCAVNLCVKTCEASVLLSAFSLPARLPEHQRAHAEESLNEFCRCFNLAFPLVERDLAGVVM